MLVDNVSVRPQGQGQVVVSWTSGDENVTTLPIYNKDLVGFILVDVIFASQLTTSRSDTFTLTAPKGNLIPNFEGFVRPM